MTRLSTSERLTTITKDSSLQEVSWPDVLFFYLAWRFQPLPTWAERDRTETCPYCVSEAVQSQVLASLGRSGYMFTVRRYLSHHLLMVLALPLLNMW